ncbi:MAG: DNA repair protein RadA [Actinomycetota bacterium]
MTSCGSCGYQAHRWFGRCPECGAWSSATAAGAHDALAVTSLAATGDGEVDRIPTTMPELDRVLGGGLVLGETVLLAGEPGIGKSTLILQMIDALTRSGKTALLVSGEESLKQVALRGARLGLDLASTRVAAGTEVDAIVAAAQAEQPDVLVVDSVQTLTVAALDQLPGSVTQVRESAGRLLRFGKGSGVALVLVGHVTKEGAVAGPKTLEHMVDAVLSLEGERSGALRLLRASKNRFGSCEETGVFVMDERGLQPVADPSALFLADRRVGVPGSAVFPALEGTRPVLFEIQALVTRSESAQLRRTALGVDGKRLALLAAVLSDRAEIRLHGRDVFVAASGGSVVREPAGDLALCLALWSAASGTPLDPALVAIGEVGLGGEVRRVPGIDRRLSEALRLGFRRALMPAGDARVPRGLHAEVVTDLRAAFEAARGGSSMPPVDRGREEPHVILG